MHVAVGWNCQAGNTGVPPASGTAMIWSVSTCSVSSPAPSFRYRVTPGGVVEGPDQLIEHAPCVTACVIRGERFLVHEVDDPLLAAGVST